MRAAAYLLLACSPAVMAAKSYHPVQDIKYTAEAYVMQHIFEDKGTPEVSVGRVDDRLKLRLCEEPLHATSASQSNSKSNRLVSVTCAAPKPWRIFVPVTVKLMAPVLVSTAPLTRNQSLDNSNVRLTKKDIYRLSANYFTEIDELKDKVLKYNVQVGTVITDQLLKYPKIIKRGDTVTIKVDSPFLQVSMSGTALTDGHLGEKIRVKNQDSKRVIHGTVTGNGTVHVQL